VALIMSLPGLLPSLKEHWNSVSLLFSSKSKRVPSKILTQVQSSSVGTDVAPSTPESAVPFVSFGSSQFSPSQIVIAPGYHAILSEDAPNVINLYLFRTSGPQTRVAQIMADDDINFSASKTIKIKGDDTYFLPGVTRISGPSKFYILSVAVL